jgi:hypothetical protein
MCPSIKTTYWTTTEDMSNRCPAADISLTSPAGAMFFVGAPHVQETSCKSVSKAESFAIPVVNSLRASHLDLELISQVSSFTSSENVRERDEAERDTKPPRI